MDDVKPRVSLTSSLCVTRDSLALASPSSDIPTSETFTSQSLWRPRGARGVFGGQVIAQALLSASHTIPSPLGLHSQHCYFLLAADAAIPITYKVEKLRDGKSYATRLVRAIQRGKDVFVLLASFALPPISLPPLKGDADTPFSFIPTSSDRQPQSPIRQITDAAPNLFYSVRSAVEPNPTTPLPHGFHSQSPSITFPGFTSRFQIPMPDGMTMWDECEPEERRWQRYLDEQGDELKGRSRTAVEEYIQERKESPVSIRLARGPRKEDVRNKRSMWLRARLAPGEKMDTETIKAMIAYMTDFQFIGTASRSVGLTRASSPRLGMLASLDHTIYFYPLPPDFEPATPLLHIMESAVADVASGRGVVRGLLYTPEGVLVAATLQEGVVRADLGKAERGLVEGGGVGDVEDQGGRQMKAKL